MGEFIVVNEELSSSQVFIMLINQVGNLEIQATKMDKR